MINTRIGISLMSIAAALALAGGAAFAVFSDTATSQDNTFSTGNADLVISNDNGTGSPDAYANDITGVTVAGLFPGQSTIKNFWLKNSSTSTGLTMALAVDLGDLGGTTPGDLPNQLSVQFICDTDNNGIGIGADSVSPNKTVNQWIAGDPESIGTVGANAGASNATIFNSDVDEKFCRMTATLALSADNSLANKDLRFDGIFLGTQNN